LENSGRRLTGFYESRESGGLPGLEIIIIMKNFHRMGNKLISTWNSICILEGVVPF